MIRFSSVATAVMLSGLVFLGACASNDQKDTLAVARGWEVEIKAAIEVKTTPKEDDATTLLTSIDTEVTKVLETQARQLVDGAIKRYDATRKPDSTVMDPALIEVVLENFAVQASEGAGVRKDVEDRKPRFSFTLRRAKGRIVPEPTRLEVTLTCVENSHAPGDTTTFSQDFRAEMLDTINKVIFDLAKSKNLDPVPPRPAQAPVPAPNKG